MIRPGEAGWRATIALPGSAQRVTVRADVAAAR